MAKFSPSKSIFYVKNYPNLSNFFFIEEYDFRGTPFVIDIFWKLQFLNHFIFYNDVQFLTTFTQVNARLKNFLMGWLLDLGLKECLVECATLCIDLHKKNTRQNSWAVTIKGVWNNSLRIKGKTKSEVMLFSVE